ncbi:MAG: hypothetical protein PHH01_02925 [Patescibacteria group bacterium]|nr:hypothetical protein [Patescibacteria group bacterium]
MSKTWPLHISLAGGEVFHDQLNENVRGIIAALARRRNSVVLHYDGENSQLVRAVEMVETSVRDGLHQLIPERLPEGLHRGVGPEDVGGQFGRLASAHGMILLAGISRMELGLFFLALASHCAEAIPPENRLPDRIAYLVPEGCDPDSLSLWHRFLQAFLDIGNKPYCDCSFLLKVTNAEDAVNWALEGRRPAVPTKEVSAACH